MAKKNERLTVPETIALSRRSFYSLQKNLNLNILSDKVAVKDPVCARALLSFIGIRCSKRVMRFKKKKEIINKK